MRKIIKASDGSKFGNFIDKESNNKKLKVYTFSSVENGPIPSYIRWFVYADSEDFAREMIDTYLSINNEYSFSDFYGGRQITKKEMKQMIDRGIVYIELTPDNFTNKEEEVRYPYKRKID